MIAPSTTSTGKPDTQLEQGHKHPDFAGVLLVRSTEALAQEALLGLRAEIQRRVRHKELSGDKQKIPRREAGAGEMETEPGIDGVADESVGAVTDELVVAVNLQLEIVVAAERRDGPDGEGDAEHDERESGPAQRLGYVELGPRACRDDRGGDDEEIGHVVGQPARTHERLAAPGHAAHPRELRDDEEGNHARD